MNHAFKLAKSGSRSVVGGNDEFSTTKLNNGDVRVSERNSTGAKSDNGNQEGKKARGQVNVGRIYQSDTNTNNKQCAFTLAETLITLVIVGIVAAVTIPIVMNNINSKQKEEKIRNVNQKLSKSTDKMFSISGMNGYANTEEFLNALKKHLSIAKICKPENIQECWGSKEVNLGEEKYDISNIKSTRDLKILKSNDGYKDVMAFVMNDGTPFIVSYNTKCDMSLSDGRIWAANKSSSTNCLSGVFDYNGGKKPNKLGDDVLIFNDSLGLGSKCAFDIGDTCYTAPKPIEKGMTQVDCESKKSTLGINRCSYNNDQWAAAAEMCGGVSNMITMEDLATLASQIYGTTIGAYKDYNCPDGNTCKNGNISSSYGLGGTNDTVWVWSSQEYSAGHSYLRDFSPTKALYGDTFSSYRDCRRCTGGMVICKGE